MADRARRSGRALLATYPGRLRTRVATTDWRLTLALVCLVTVGYLGQVLAAIHFGTSVRGVTAFLFLSRPDLAWPLAPFLHGPLPHVLANVAVLVPVGIEAQRHLSDRQYVGLFLVSSAAASLVALATTAPFTDGPVAAYGISGFVFALATHLLVSLPRSHEGGLLALMAFDADPHPLEVVAVFLGLSVVLVVTADVGLALLDGFRGVNGGHLGGALVGVASGVYRRRGSCPRSPRADRGGQPAESVRGDGVRSEGVRSD